MLLAGLQAHGLVRIDSEDFYVLTLKGEKITSRPDFYAAFVAPVEMAVRHASEEIGKLPTGIGLREEDRHPAGCASLADPKDRLEKAHHLGAGGQTGQTACLFR